MIFEFPIKKLNNNNPQSRNKQHNMKDNTAVICIRKAQRPTDHLYICKITSKENDI